MKGVTSAGYLPFRVRPMTSGGASGQHRVITVLVTAFLTFDAVIHILDIEPVVDGSRQLGFDPAEPDYFFSGSCPNPSRSSGGDMLTPSCQSSQTSASPTLLTSS